jgi:hypothetical protein
MRRKRATRDTQPRSKGFLSTVTEQMEAFHVSASSPAFFCPMRIDPDSDLDTVKRLPILKHDPSLGIKRSRIRKDSV